MKNVFKNSILPALFCAFATIIIGMGCSPSDTAEENYENTPPDIIVISPNSGDIFFTLGGEDAPDFINIEAVFEAADGIDLDEEVSTAIIYDADNNVVYTCNISEATNSSGKAILHVNDRFETHNTGPYRIVFTAINEAQPIINEEGAKRTAEIYVDCNPSETDTN